MAYRSSGVNNDEMVDKLKRFGVIRSPAVEEGFRAVDRRFFVPRNRPEMAHVDQPLKEGNIHISAPHIYGAVVEALDLVPNKSMSFLNLGSGTGYLTCVVAEILGTTSICYGVEINEDVVSHYHASVKSWAAARSSSGRHAPLPQMEVIHGNALQIETTAGECAVGFDRIYIGASIEKCTLSTMAGLLRPGGVLIGPVDDELVKVIRIGKTKGPVPAPLNTADTTSLPRSLRARAPPLSDDFTMQVISGVRFSRLLANPALPTTIRSRVWEPALHHLYPPSFRESCKEILLCSRAPVAQPPVVTPVKHGINVASTLPRALWMEILSYTHRDWFEQPRSEEDFLRKRLMEEQAAARRSQEACLEAEARLHMAERERDVYRLLALRWQARLQTVLNRNRGTAGAGNRGNAEDIDDDHLLGLDDLPQASLRLSGNDRLLLGMGGLGAMIRRFRANDDDDDEDEDDDNNGEDDDEDDDNEDDDDEISHEDDDNNLMEVQVDVDSGDEGASMEDITEANDEMAITATGSIATKRTVSLSGSEF